MKVHWSRSDDVQECACCGTDQEYLQAIQTRFWIVNQLLTLIYLWTVGSFSISIKKKNKMLFFTADSFFRNFFFRNSFCLPYYLDLRLTWSQLLVYFPSIHIPTCIFIYSTCPLIYPSLRNNIRPYFHFPNHFPPISNLLLHSVIVGILTTHWFAPFDHIVFPQNNQFGTCRTNLYANWQQVF